MAALAESRKNMAIDMRPKVLMKVMSLELLIALFALTMTVCVPFYFLKVIPRQEQIKREARERTDEQQEMED